MPSQILAVFGVGLAVCIITLAPPRAVWAGASEIRDEGEAGPGDVGAVMSFDIPAQQLASALMAFGSAASARLFFDSVAVEGRRSTAVRGTFSAAAALRRLLEGTGLVARSFEQGTITIVPARNTPLDAEMAAAQAAASAFRPYLAAVQEGLRSSLCRTASAFAGESEILAQIWIAQDGAVTRAELLGPALPASRKRVYLAALEAAVFPSPPAAMPQPATLLIRPRSARTGSHCAAGGRLPDLDRFHD